MDTEEGNQEDPLSLHKYLYCHDNPINGIDPSGHAVYFVERHFVNPFHALPAWPLGYGHGYLLFTAQSDPGTTDPFWTHQQIQHTFSWHPNVWDYQGSQTPGRVWENDYDHDWTPGIRQNAIRVTIDADQQSVLFHYIRGWISAKNTGYEVGRPKPDPNDPDGNTVGRDFHKNAPSGGEFYSLDQQNCIWWVTTMLMQSGINVPLNVYTEIDNYDRGWGDSHQMVGDYMEEQVIKRRPVNLDWSGTPGDFPGGLNFGF